jgi:hypothetical protein
MKFVGLAVVIAGVLVAGLGVKSHLDAQTIIENPATTQGTIIEKTKETKNRAGRHRRNRTIYEISVEYEVNHAKYKIERQVSSREYSAILIGEKVPVRYASTTPNLAELPEIDSWMKPYLIILLGVALIIGGVFEFYCREEPRDGDFIEFRVCGIVVYRKHR